MCVCRVYSTPSECARSLTEKTVFLLSVRSHHLILLSFRTHFGRVRSSSLSQRRCVAVSTVSFLGLLHIRPMLRGLSGASFNDVVERRRHRRSVRSMVALHLAASSTYLLILCHFAFNFMDDRESSCARFIIWIWMANGNARNVCTQ